METDSTPLVTVVIPVYNAENFLEGTVKSVIKQTYQRLEIIIIDDCSTDSSYEVMRELSSEDQRIRLLHLDKNRGVACARNQGISEAKGKYVSFLDSDDLWVKEKIEMQMDFMVTQSAKFTYTSFKNIDEKGRPISVQKVKKKVSYTDILKTNDIYTSTVMIETDLLKKYKMPNLKLRQDLSTWLNILKGEGCFAYGLNVPLTKYRVRSNSLSRNKFTAMKFQWKVYRDNQELSLIKSGYYFLHYLFWGLLKTQRQKFNIFGG